MLRLPGFITRRSMAVGALAVAALAFAGPASAQITAVVTESGQVSLSLDAAGTNNASHTIDFVKPVGATVRGVYLASATYQSVGDLPDGAVTIDGVSVNWDIKVNNPWGGGTFENGWADLTGTSVTTTLNNAPAGPGTLTITEPINNTLNDGEILAIIWDDPNIPATQDQGIILLFGGQALGGDTFNINLAEPLDLSSPDVKADLSLGISFSFQVNGPGQQSDVDVNGSPLSRSAGGEDDGNFGSNGSLITVGGIGDSNDNPPPLALPVNSTDPDDELYDLLPFYTPGSTLISVDTFNASNDDNIFFGAICTSVAAITQGILLSPGAATCMLGEDATVTALVLDSTGAPVVGTDVDFEIVAGPNAGETGSGTTDANGEATFTWNGDGGEGTDCIVATFVDNQGETQTSNESKKTWVEQCMLVIGDSTFFAPYDPAGHEYMTQVGNVESMEPVLLEDLATLTIPVKLPSSFRSQSVSGSALPYGESEVIERFTAQVLMWNPQAFPSQPEKFTQGLMVTVTRNGDVDVVPYGQAQGMDLWVETNLVTDPAPGTSLTPYVEITFPFTIDD